MKSLAIDAEEGVGVAAVGMAVGVVTMQMKGMSRKRRGKVLEILRGVNSKVDAYELEQARRRLVELLAGEEKREIVVNRRRQEDTLEERLGNLDWEQWGKQLREYRKRVGMRQAELAKRGGLKQSQVSRVERGEVRPGMRTLVKIANGLGVELDSMMYAEEGAKFGW